MATTKRTTRQKKLDRIITSIARFALSDVYADESAARDHLANAMNELKQAADWLVESES